MELFADRQDRESKDAAEKTEPRQSGASRRAAPRGRSVGKVQKKRRLGRKTSGARRAKKRMAAPAVPSQGLPSPAPSRPEPPPLIPQPTLDSPEEEPSEPEEPRQEPPPPSASANPQDGDDLFEYVF